MGSLRSSPNPRKVSLQHILCVRLVDLLGVYKIFLSIEYTICAKSLKVQESLVLDLKILMYRNADEIEKLKRIKEDSDREAVTILQQLKDQSASRDMMQQELVTVGISQHHNQEWLVSSNGASEMPRGMS